jgi:hypothetical protein
MSVPLWCLRFREDDGDRARLQEVLARHAGCIASLRSRCLRMLAPGEVAPAK